MARIRQTSKGWLVASLFLAACESGPGGITAQLVFSEGDGKQALRTQAVPSLIDHLQISALDTNGSTLATTHLRITPGEGEQRLDPAGGTWELKSVASGEDRVIRATAFLGPSPTPRLDRALAYVGTRTGIEVSPGEINDIGVLTLNRAPIRIPETDDEPPSPPNPVSVLPVPTGGALRVTFQKPSDDDVAGYVLALARTASITGDQPLIAPRTVVGVDDAIGSGFVVKAIWAFQRTEIITLSGLEDGVPYSVLVYAYDGDDPDDPTTGNPLNFSSPASGFASPGDATPPGPLVGLAAIPAGGAAEISFTAPSDDRGGGLNVPVSGFELRAALTRTELDTVPAFEGRPDVLPPPAAGIGAPVRFTRTLAELGIAPGISFFVAMRALDAADNPGPIAVAELTYNATIAPTIGQVSPPIGLAGREVIISGRDFGVTRGTAQVVATETSTLTYVTPIVRWGDSEVAVILPQDARTGDLSLTRPDGRSATVPLVILGRGVGPFDEYEFPFEIVGRDLPGGRSLAVLYAERDFSDIGALERVFEGVPEPLRYLERSGTNRSTSVAGAYSPRLDLFWLLANDEPNEMSAAFISSSTVTPTDFRLDAAVAAGSAESVSVVFLDVAAGPAAGMIAFSVGGVIRTATVADVRTDRFNGFYATSSTVSLLDRVHLAQKSDGALLLAWRDNGVTDYLRIANNPIGLDPNAFAPVAATPVETGPGIEVVAIDNGATDDFVIAYEAREPGGRLEVRLLRAADYGTRRGYAPFTPIATDRRLDDLGLVTRGGQTYLVLVASRVDTNVEPSYAEIPLSALLQSLPDGGHPGVVLDTAPVDTRVRLGCRERPLASCPVFLSSQDAALMFIRH